MKIIVAIDDNNGLLFNHRRLSKDRELRKRMLELVGDGKLLIGEFSRKQFRDELQEMPEKIVVDDDFLQRADDGAYCFIEDADVSGCFGEISEIILYKWNREYPADTFFSFPEEDYAMTAEEEFPGYSHEVITEQRYSRIKEGGASHHEEEID